MQHSSHIMMIKPVKFGFNQETAVNNSFQVPGNGDTIQEEALKEFTAFTDLLTLNGIDVTIIEDSPVPHTPDSIFPNNWLSFQEGGQLILYPMFAENRRKERKQKVLDLLHQKFIIEKSLDLTAYESTHLFLEGTGSMVLDREHKIAYACLSPRTDPTILEIFCTEMAYRSCTFLAVDEKGEPIYHTNVMMCIADKFAVVCLECIKDIKEQQLLIDCITQTGKQIIPISIDQMNHFAGNMLQVHNQEGKVFLVMSSQAYHSLTEDQINEIEQYNSILHSSIATIEKHGGGSARCMMAEVFLKEKKA